MADKNQPPANPPATPPPAAGPPAGGPPAGPPADASARLDAIEAHQRATDGKLDTIIDKLTGQPSPPAGGGDPAGPPAPADVGAQVRAELEKAEAARRREEGEKADKNWRKNVDETLAKIKPETTPREPQTGLRGRLQRAMYGRDV